MINWTPTKLGTIKAHKPKPQHTNIILKQS